MKITSIIAAFTLTFAAASHGAVNLTASSFRNGLSTSAGVALDGTSVIRYGIFTTGFNFSANAADSVAMETAFTQVVQQVGVSLSGFDGYFQHALTGINEAGTFEGVSYATGIAGKNIYAWVLNQAGTEQGVFSSGEVWGDTSTPDFTFTLQDDAPGGITTHIGSATGPEIFSGLGNSYKLATIGAVPEPSRAFLGLLGLGALFFRRRR